MHCVELVRLCWFFFSNQTTFHLELTNQREDGNYSLFLNNILHGNKSYFLNGTLILWWNLFILPTRSTICHGEGRKKPVLSSHKIQHWWLQVDVLTLVKEGEGLKMQFTILYNLFWCGQRLISKVQMSTHSGLGSVKPSFSCFTIKNYLFTVYYHRF